MCAGGMLLGANCARLTCYMLLQTLLRGVVPDSFPLLLSAVHAQPGERRLVAIDDNVYRLYGAQIHQVRVHMARCWCCIIFHLQYHSPAYPAPGWCKASAGIVHP